MRLLTTSNPKTSRSSEFGYYTAILHLSPWRVSGFGNTCPRASEGCKAACLNTSGHGGMFVEGGTNAVQEARKRRTELFFTNRDMFMSVLAFDIQLAQEEARRMGLKLAVRLNGTSDLSWEKYRVPGTKSHIFSMFPDVQFYDYTKVLGRKVSDISNYHLTFSRSESNAADVARAISSGMNVACVFKGGLPESWQGLPVINGDIHDLRFLDPAGVIVGLKPKGRGRKDSSGFVIPLALAA